MADLSRFSGEGFTTIKKKSAHNYGEVGEVTLLYNKDSKKVYVSIDPAVARIAYGTVDLSVSFVIDHKKGRLYIVADEKGYSLKGRKGNTKASYDVRLSTYSSPLYHEMTKRKYSQIANTDLKHDDRLDAYYVELK